jgi:hypothetical protein
MKKNISFIILLFLIGTCVLIYNTTKTYYVKVYETKLDSVNHIIKFDTIKIIEDKYINDSKRAEIDLANFKLETEKNIEKEKIDIKQNIALLEAEINLEKVKGTEQEFAAWSELQFAKFRILEENYNLDLEKYKDNAEKKKEIDLEFQKDSLELQKQTFTKEDDNSKKKVEKTKEQKKDEILAIVNAAQQLTDSLFQIQQNQIQAELNKDQDKYNEKQTLLQQQLDAGIISQTEFNAQKSKLDSDYAKQESKLKKEAFEKNKQAQLINAIIATATGVAQSLPNLVLAGIAAALGAVQVATIVSQPTPKFEKGGMFGGKPHSAGGTKGYFDDGTQIESYHDRYDKHYKSITQKDIHNAIKKYLIKQNMTVCILGSNNPELKVVKEICDKIQ